MSTGPDARLMLEIEGRSWPLHHGDVIGRLGTVAGDVLRHHDVLSRQHLRVEHESGRWQITLLPNVQNITLCNHTPMSPGTPVPVLDACEIQVVTLALRLCLETTTVNAEHPAGLITLDIMLRVDWRNAEAARLLRHDLPPGEDFLQGLETGSAMHLRHALTALREGAEMPECEAALRAGEATEWIAVRAVRSGGRLLLTVRDVTREREQRAAVEHAAARLDARIAALTTLLTAKPFVDGDLAAALPLLMQDAAMLLDDTEVSAWLSSSEPPNAASAPTTFTCRAIAGAAHGSTGRTSVLSSPPPRGEASPITLATLRDAGLLDAQSTAAWLEPLDGHGLLVFQRTGAQRGWLEPETRLAGLAAALGRQLFSNAQRREAMSALQAHEAELSSELSDAAQYVESRLPAVLTKGSVEMDWVYQPCGRLGGDIFGYEWLDDRRFAIYIADVMGHGSKAALHALSLSQTLKLLLARGAGDDPAAWLAALNAEFPMNKHQDLLWTMWCGLYDRSTRTLRHASGGHPPALLFAGGGCEELSTEGPVLGAMLEAEYRSASRTLPDDARLYLYTDGAYEFPTASGDIGTLEDFKAAVGDGARMEHGECQFLQSRAAALCAEPEFPDDFTVVRARFTG